MANFANFLRFLSIMAVAAMVGPPVATLAAEPATMPTFNASYKVRYGILSGEMTLRLWRRDAAYTYETALRPRGVASWLRRGEIREFTTLSVSTGGIRPLDYTNTDTIARPERFARYVFDQPAGRVVGEYKTRAINEPMRPNGQNRISAQVAIIHALQSGVEISSLPVFDRGRWRDFSFEVRPGERAKTPSGDFEVVEVRYSSTDKQKSWSLYCAGELHYLPVMIEFRENGKTKSRARLADYEVNVVS